MWFLIEYDRKEGKLVSIKRFRDEERLKAESTRLNLEIQLNRVDRDHEVVLLHAASEGALRRTHRRYFETLQELAS